MKQFVQMRRKLVEFKNGERFIERSAYGSGTTASPYAPGIQLQKRLVILTHRDDDIGTYLALRLRGHHRFEVLRRYVERRDSPLIPDRGIGE